MADLHQPLLLLALEEYFTNPSPEVLSRLYDSLNAIPTTGIPSLSRNERILLRQSDRKDLLEERFLSAQQEAPEYFEGASEAGTSLEASSSVSQDRRDAGAAGSRSEARKSASESMRTNQQVPSRKPSLASVDGLGYLTSPTGSGSGRLTPDGSSVRGRVPRDTHFFETEARLRKITMPIRIPMTVFDEDIGDVSIAAVQLTEEAERLSTR